MSDDDSRHDYLPTEGGKVSAENGPETVEDDQTGLPPWAVALTAQLQMPVADQLATQDKAHRAELQELVAECRARAHDSRTCALGSQFYGRAQAVCLVLFVQRAGNSQCFCLFLCQIREGGFKSLSSRPD